MGGERGGKGLAFGGPSDKDESVLGSMLESPSVAMNVET